MGSTLEAVRWLREREEAAEETIRPSADRISNPNFVASIGGFRKAIHPLSGAKTSRSQLGPPAEERGEEGGEGGVGRRTRSGLGGRERTRP